MNTGILFPHSAAAVGDVGAKGDRDASLDAVLGLSCACSGPRTNLTDVGQTSVGF